MRNRSFAVVGLTLSAALFAGACTDTQITEPVASSPDSPSLFGGPASHPGSFVTRDALFAQLSRDIPGFAGVYRDESGVLNVRMVPGIRSMSAVQAQRVAGERLAAMGIELGMSPVTIQSAQFDFAHLHQIHGRIDAVMSIGGVVYTGVDQRSNRVEIAVENASAAADVERALQQLGVERDAIVITETEPITAMQTLRDRIRPVGGGLQLMGGPDGGGAYWYCTLGFNVRSPERPSVRGFITNSHCTNVMYGLPVGTQFHQPNAPAFGGVDAFVGTEVHDVPLFTGGACPVGRQCRWSDAAGVQYASGVEQAFGNIYRTTAPGSLTIDPVNPMYTIVAERAFPLVGDEMHKVGRTTGWSTGPVTQDCVNINLGGTPIPNLTILCSDRVVAAVAGGDSGSPVFDLAPGGGPNDVRLTGILYGGGGGSYVFSAMDNIRFEHPAPSGLTWVTH
jgi:hypothetical protein